MTREDRETRKERETKTEREFRRKQSIEKKSNALLLSSFSRPSSTNHLSNSKQTDASYTTIADTPEWQELKEHVSEIDKT